MSGCWVGVLDGISGLCAKVAWVEVMLSNGAEDDMMIYMLVGDFTGGLGRNSFYESRKMKAQKYYSSKGGLVTNSACKCSGKILRTNTGSKGGQLPIQASSFTAPRITLPLSLTVRNHRRVTAAKPFSHDKLTKFVSTTGLMPTKMMLSGNSLGQQ